MEVELIPVLEIFNYGQNLDFPKIGSSWEYPDEWNEHNQKSNTLAGYSNDLIPYLKGQLFYKINEIKDHDLLNLLNKEFEESRNESGQTELENLCELEGGLILKLNQKDVLFPQCCGKLSDIRSWSEIIEGNVDYFYNGHPSPIVTITKDIVRFEPTSEYKFTPYPHLIVEVEKSLLDTSIEKASNEIRIFCDRLPKLNLSEEYKIKGFEEVLVYGEYPD